jgi:hypothetical protein
MRHAKAYKYFIEKIFEVDPNEAMLAFEDMMRKKIVMPAHFLREMGLKDWPNLWSLYRCRTTPGHIYRC